MRKLLVASQKGGVGKTTTSINLAAGTAKAGARVLLLDADPLSNISTSLNLAAHPHRKPLREAGLDLPGALVVNVVPGLDVLSPYDEGGCSDEDLDDLLSLLGHPSFQKSYGCLIVDTPPFMGAKPAQLLATCDQYILVMRAEPMAYRTLPAFLELVQRSRKEGHDVQMRGILLTLPDGEAPGGRWERELRGRFGTRILPQVIPYDEEVSKALVFGQIATQSAPGTMAALQYHGLVESLNLAQDARVQEEVKNPLTPLIAAAAALKAAGVLGASTRRAAVAAASRPAPQPLVHVAARPELEQPERELWNETEETEAPPLQIVPTTSSPTRLLSELEIPVMPSFEGRSSSRPPAGPPPRTGKAARGTGPRGARPAGEVPEPAREGKPAPVPQRGASPILVGVGVAASIVLGVAVQRVPELLAYVVPLLIGLAVAGVVVILLKAFGSSGDDRASETPVGDKPSTRTPPRKGSEPKSGPLPARKEPGSRLIPRRPSTPHRRDLGR